MSLDVNKEINGYAAKKLKEFRTSKNLTQKELAEELGITQQQIARYENNLRKFKQDFLFKLADYFNISINDFFPPIKSDKEKEEQNETYKRILKEKGLMDENDYINEEQLNKLLKIADMVKDLQQNNKE